MSVSSKSQFENLPCESLQKAAQEEGRTIATILQRVIWRKSIYEIRDDKTVFVEVDRITKGQLQDVRPNALTGDLYASVFEGICLGRNLGRLLLNFPVRDYDVSGIPDLGSVPTIPTESETQETERLLALKSPVRALLDRGAYGIVDMHHGADLYGPARSAAAYILLHTERQAQAVTPDFSLPDE